MKKIALSEIANYEGWEFGALMPCPVCGFESTHVIQVFATMANDPEGQPEPGFEIYGIPVGGVNGNRRPSVDIRAFCENGLHEFIWRLQQHKGATYLEAFDLKEVNPQ